MLILLPTVGSKFSNQISPRFTLSPNQLCIVSVVKLAYEQDIAAFSGQSCRSLSPARAVSLGGLAQDDGAVLYCNASIKD